MFDQPNKLYLGREFDRNTGATGTTPVNVALRDLTTHAVCLGMTGTGKTGLGIVALEEALLQDVPCVIVDPKGDITNLALNFPELSPAEFLRWLDADEARRQGLTPEQYAEQTSTRWRNGLAESGIAPERLRAVSERIKFDIFTPGSDAGIPVNVLHSLNPPDDPAITWAKHTETLRDRIAQVVSAILDLAGIDADPIKSREHILLSTIFESAWRAGQKMSVEALIQMVQQPPIVRIGAFDLEVFYPKTERFDLAMSLNNLAASPSFGAWMNGQPLDIAKLISPDRSSLGVNPIGRTRACIFYTAHLDDAERQFFTTLLLSQLVLWMRAQSGATQLRCLVYFDEVHGYCPPFPRNPPTKAPLMSIIKQGRAAGLGLFLATQNPADLDYKGLSNIGTWFIGRLRTGRDRDRALEGLEGAGAGFDRSQVEDALSMLPPRVFLLQSATGDPRFFRTRWAMSFLRGPLTRDQIMLLTDGDPRKEPAATAPPATFTARSAASDPRAAPPPNNTPAHPPALPPDVRQVYWRRSAFVRDGEPLVYRPHLFGSAAVRITDRGSGVMHDQRHTYLLPLDPHALAPDFSRAERIDLDLSTLTREPEGGAVFEPVASGVNARWMKKAERALNEHLYRSGGRTIWRNATLKAHSRLDESQIDFRQRCELLARERRDAEGAKVRAVFERRMKSLQDKLAREHRELSQDQTELGARKREELLSGVESVFNFVIGRASRHAVAFGAQRRRQTQMAQEDVRETRRAIEQLDADLTAVAAEYKSALAEVSDKWMRALADMQDVLIAPKKSDIFVDVIAVAWVAG
jgi:hypothetical protein